MLADDRGEMTLGELRQMFACLGPRNACGGRLSGIGYGSEADGIAEAFDRLLSDENL